MNSINAMKVQADLALAAYADLTGGVSGDDYISALQQRGEGMSREQAASFASRWRVVDQYTHSETYEEEVTNPDGQTTIESGTRSNGLSVTLFEEVGTGRQVVAIRGTEPSLDDLRADGGIVLHGVPRLSDQYQSLQQTLDGWIASNRLGDSFTVTGHSLGGWLAAGVVEGYAARVEHAWMYNAPGVNGIASFLELRSALGLPVWEGDPAKVTNVRAAAGSPPRSFRKAGRMAA